MEIRDPIHGALAVDDAEVAVIDHPWLQRLRDIRQTGFSCVPFPGATHSRFSHSLGVMHLAGLAFDRVTADTPFASAEGRARCRHALRLAALCHDIGHAPFSHCMEFAMPPAAALRSAWLPAAAGRRASHEDYTVAILEQTDLGRAVGASGAATARHVASLISDRVDPGDDFFLDGGVDHRPLLSQIVSSELDVDRLDYLPRDALYTGTRYGTVDAPWLLSNLRAHVDGATAFLALSDAAVLAFEHFLLARHHMFLMVYFHHKSVVFEELLRRHVADEGAVPSDLDAYLQFDDVSFQAALRQQRGPFGRRIVEHRPYRRLVERQGTAASVDLSAVVARIADAGIDVARDVIHTTSTQRLSRYAGPEHRRDRAQGLRVLGVGGRVTPLGEAAAVFRRYEDAHVIGRIYVSPECWDRAVACTGP